MGFIRENLLKIVIFVIVLIIVVFIFAFVFGGKKNSVTTSYSSMEEKMVESTKKYLNKNQKLFPKEDEVTKINLDTLENAGYLSSYNAIEDSNVKCSGYTEVQNKNKNYIYTPYLKCGKYYETKTLASYIKDNEKIVASGDGLYNIGDTYVFRGENPNNYIKVGDRLYRIIDIKDNNVRLISQKRIQANTSWDDRYNTEKNNNYGINTYSKSRLKEFFDEIIKNNSTNQDANYFSDQEIEKMSSFDLCVGKRSSSFGDISSANECNQIEQNQKIGLITVSDYARASLDQNCKTIFDKSCMNYNYFTGLNYSIRTVTATSDNTYEIFYIDNGVATLSKASRTFSPNIVINLDALSLYLDGDGTSLNPYTIR